jgi:CheY-like chemotaxis protein
MNGRYEVVFSPNEPALKLIFLEGTWESLPFEIRLSRPWRGGTLCTDATLTSLQRQEIAQRGYSIGHANVLGELISNQSGTPTTAADSTRPVRPIEVSSLASADDHRATLKRMRRSLQELNKAIEQSMSLIVEAQFALGAELTCLPSGQAVLVVEDDDHVRRMSVAALRELGYRVDEAASGADALTLLNTKPEINLLFTDVVMPEMNGRRLAETALKRRPALKVLYTTGYMRTVFRDGTLDPDVDLIAKPFTVDQLDRKVRAVLGVP